MGTEEQGCIPLSHHPFIANTTQPGMYSVSSLEERYFFEMRACSKVSDGVYRTFWDVLFV